MTKYNLSSWNKIQEEPPELKHNQIIVLHNPNHYNVVKDLPDTRLFQFKGNAKDGVFINPPIKTAANEKPILINDYYSWAWMCEKYTFFCLASDDIFQIIPLIDTEE